MWGFLSSGVAGLTLGMALGLYFAANAWIVPVGQLVVVIALVPMFFGCLMAIYAVIGKYRTRDAILDTVTWRGDEQVLDVGTGAGLLLVGAAKRLTSGHATGIDIWSGKDLSDNAEAATLNNIAIEGVAKKVTVLSADATRMPFSDASFDIVISLLCLHNIEPDNARMQACYEIARVLRPGGRVIVGDYIPTKPYAEAFERQGLRVISTGNRFGTALSLMWFTVAERPL